MPFSIKRVFESSLVPIVVMDAATFKYIDCNPAAVKIYNFVSRNETLGKTMSDVSAPVQYDGTPSPEKAKFYIAKTLTEGTIVFEWRHQRPNGELWDAEVHLMSFRSGERELLQFTLQDITERKRAEEERERLIIDIQNALGAVSQSQKEWQDTFDSITDMISIHDKEFTVIKANKAFSSFLGLSPEEVINRKCFELMHHGALLPIAGCPHQRTLHEKTSVSVEIFEEHINKTFRVTTYPYYSPSGEIIGSIHISRDITEEKEREIGLIMTERLASLGQMASGIAHEINNPLASVMICAEMLQMKVAKDNYDHAQFEKYLKTIDEEVQRCRDITGNMLSFFRQAAAEKQDIDIHLLLDKTVDLMGYQGRLKNVRVLRQYGRGFHVRGNEGELRQVFLVLVINALDAMANKGTLTIETGTQDGSAWIRISDTGPGIPQEILDKVFQPFFTTKTGKGGTGLGLSIAYRIIANHLGSLTASSEPGLRTAFTIQLPV